MRDSQCGAADGKAYSGSLLPSSTASLFPDNLFAHQLPPLSLGGIMRSCTWLNHIKKKKKKQHTLQKAVPQQVASYMHATSNFTSGCSTLKKTALLQSINGKPISCEAQWPPRRATGAATPWWPSSLFPSRHPAVRSGRTRPAFSPPGPPCLPPTAWPGPHLQLPGGHAGRQLDDTAHRHACRPSRVQLVPNGVTVHLSKQPAPREGQGREGEGKGEGEHERKQTREGGLAAWQPVYNNISLPSGPAERPSGHGFTYAFSLHGLLQWKHIPVMPRCHSLFRFLITNSITSARLGLLTGQWTPCTGSLHWWGWGAASEGHEVPQEKPLLSQKSMPTETDQQPRSWCVLKLAVKAFLSYPGRHHF